MFTLWTDCAKHLSSTKWVHSMNRLCYSLRYNDCSPLILSKSITTLQSESRRIFQTIGLSFFILFLSLIKLMKLSKLSLLSLFFFKLFTSEMKNIPFIPASEYLAVGEAIRPFDYRRWGLIYVVLINAQQSWLCFIWIGCFVQLFCQHCSDNTVLAKVVLTSIHCTVWLLLVVRWGLRSSSISPGC